ncbi:MAG: trigger factor [Pseudomonadota bacterium]
MQVIETSRTGLAREYDVIVSAKDIEEKMAASLSEIAGQVRIPGFRPGKAPMPMLKKRYGDAVRGEVLERAVQDSSTQALMEQGVRPAAQPKIEIKSFEDGADLKYSLAVETLPEIEPIDFSSLKLEKLVAEPSDENLDEALGRIAAENPDIAPVDPPRPAANGDIVTIDFVGKIDDVAFDGGSAEGFDLKLGEGRFIPGFEDQLVGAEAEKSVTVNVTFPEDYPAENLKGKPAVFEVDVKAVKAETPRAVDDSLAEALGLEKLDALKDAVRERMRSEFGQLSRARLKRALLDALADAHKFETPASLVEGEFDAIWGQLKAEIDRAKDKDGDEKPDEEKLKTEYREIAERRVRLGLLLTEVGRTNNIEVSQEDLNRALMDEARRYPGRENEVINYYRNEPKAIESLRAPLYEDKVVDFILALAQVEEKTVDVSELTQDPDAESDGDGDGDSADKA